MADILVRDVRTGEVFPVREEDAATLIQQGLVVPSEGERSGSSATGNAVERFFASMASEGTLGATDILRRELGVPGAIAATALQPLAGVQLGEDIRQGTLTGEEMDLRQRQLAEEHPVADIAGRVTMGVGQAFAGNALSGAGTAARLGRAFMSPVGFADEAGSLAARAISGGISGRAGRVATALGRWGVEGAVAGAEGTVIASNAYDQPLTGEALLAGLGFGATAGIGIGALGRGASAGLRRLRANRIANGSVGQGPLDRLLGRTQQILGGVDDAHIRAGQDPEIRRLATLPEPELDMLALQHADRLNEIQSGMRRLINDVGTGVDQYRHLMGRVDPMNAETAALDFLNDGMARIRRELQEHTPFNRADLETLNSLLSHRANRILDLGRASEMLNPHELFGEMHSLAKTIGDRAAGITDPGTKRVFDDMYNALQGQADHAAGTWQEGFLSRQDLWDEAGLAHARFAQTTHELRNFTTNIQGRMLQRTTRVGEPVADNFTIGKVRGALEAMGTIRGDNLNNSLDEWLLRNRELADLYETHMGGGTWARELRDLVDNYAGPLAEARRTFDAVSIFKQGQAREQAMRGFGAAAGIGGTAVAGGLLGYGITGDPLASIPIALGFAALTRPMLYYRFLASKDRMLGQFQTRFTGAMSRFRQRLRGASKAIRKRSARGYVSPLVAPLMVSASKEQREQEFEDRVEELRQLQANPQALIDNVGDSLSDVSIMDPQMASYMHDAIQRGLQYLWAHLPPSEQNPLGPQFRRRPPSDTERDHFLRVFRVVEDPLSAVDDLADLRLHPLSAAALRDVYPEIFQLTRSEIVYELGELEMDPPYQVKINLGVLLGYPTDVSLDPDFMRLLQSRSAQTTEQAQTVGLSRQGARGDVSSLTMTETTRLMNPE